MSSAVAARVLVVEDSPTQAEEVRLILESAGCHVETAGDGAAGLDRLARPPAFDLVISDIVMPGLSGYDVCSRVKSNAATKRIPVLLLTSLTDPIDVIRALEAGADSFLSKPSAPEHLIARVNGLLENRRLRATARTTSGVDILFGGKRFTISSDKPQILDLLVSTFEDAVRKNHELIAASDALRRAKETAEGRNRVLLDVTNAIITSLNRDTLFDAIFQALRGVLHFDRASLVLADSTRAVGTVQALASSSEHPELLSVLPVGTEFPYDGTAVGRALRDRRPIVVRNMSREPAVWVQKPLVDLGIRSGIVAPLFSAHGAVGAVLVGSLTPDQYTDDDAELLTDVGKQLAVAIENMLAYEEIARLKARLEQENLYLQEEAGIAHGLPELVGESAALRTIAQAVETVAPTDATVLLTGETGTGKELIARAIHTLSPRCGNTMVKVNCAALPAGLIESELFGHEKGAFTGALARKLGRFELANHGTILLDEIGDLPLELQAKLLRVLQEGEFERVGGTQPIKVDARVIASTNRDLEDAIREGRFRSDLYYRLSVFPISAPPLRDRKEDIPPLVRHLVMKCCGRFGKRVETIPQTVMAALESYAWPGNVRELQNVIERAVILTRGPRLELGDWMPRAHNGPQGPASLTLEDVERRHLRSVLESTGWRVSGKRGAASILGLRPTTLEARMKKLGIHRPG